MCSETHEMVMWMCGLALFMFVLFLISPFTAAAMDWWFAKCDKWLRR